MYASLRGDLDILRPLLQHHADVNIQSNLGLTALMLATLKGFEHVIKLLVEEGSARVDLLTNINSSVLTLINPKLNADIVHFLCQHGCEANHKNKYQVTPLLGLLNSRFRGAVDVSMVRCLIEHETDVNAANCFGVSPLLAAVANCHSSQVINCLIDNGAEVNQTDSKNRTPLMLTIINGPRRLVKEQIDLLLDRGATVTNEIHAALLKDNDDAVQRLIAGGAEPRLCRLSSKEMPRFVLEKFLAETPMSPLFTAIICLNVQCFMKFIYFNFLHPSDISPSSELLAALGRHLHQRNKEKYIRLIATFVNQSRTLTSLSFLKVSTHIGFGRSRQQRVGAIQITDDIRQRLLFEEELDSDFLLDWWNKEYDKSSCSNIVFFSKKTAHFGGISVGAGKECQAIQCVDNNVDGVKCDDVLNDSTGSREVDSEDETMLSQNSDEVKDHTNVEITDYESRHTESRIEKRIREIREHCSII